VWKMGELLSQDEIDALVAQLFQEMEQTKEEQ
jgi:flagellar motor switch protein FliM